MECRKFEITLISANNLEDVRRIWKMKVHARVSIGSDPETEKRTPTDKHGETNPAWNFTLNYTISESMIQNYNTMLVIKLYCKRKLGDRYIGEVHTPMKELFDCAYHTDGTAVMTFPVQKGCVNSQGALRISYRFGEKVMIDKLLLAQSVANWSFR
ncbi:soybean protein regulated by cold-2 [Abeliophyllum distichum]|uniref:Soybean protein regulated by cold-2 n=1 Tax=Abeliophyllum distichum TaxID=126358 RepID=A0ABD1SS86_9LAMI